MIIAMLFGAIVSTLIHGTVNQPDCKKFNNEPKACKVSEVLETLGK
jgi:hypothetical protein